MSRFILFGAVSLAALGFAACGDGNSDLVTTDTTIDSASADPAAMENAAREGQDFVNAAGQASLVEIRTSEMALEKSTNADVKAFAQLLIDHHKAGVDKLKAAASAAAMQPPADVLDDFHMRRINDLVETDGDADFDADYAALQVDAHNDAIKLFEDYSNDPDATAQLKVYADESLPMLMAHKTQAETIRDAANKTDTASNPSNPG